METVNGLLDAQTQKALLALAHAILGASRVAEGLNVLDLGFLPRIPEAYARRVKAGVRIACGVLQIAAAILLGGLF